MVIKTEWYQHKGRNTDQQNRETRINPHITGQIIFDKDTKTTQGVKDSFFNKRHWENKISTSKRTRVDIYLTPYVKINSKWINT